jgi:hypothetical protein
VAMKGSKDDPDFNWPGSRQRSHRLYSPQASAANPAYWSV